MANKKVKISGVPLDLGAHSLGVNMGPDSIRYAGLTDALSFNSIEYLDYGNIHIQHLPNKSSKEIISKVSEQLAQLTFDAIVEGYIPVILGGDHSVSIGSISGVAKATKNLGLIWIDFHPDANTPESSPSGNIHGMPVAISLGYGYPELVNCAGFSPKVLPENLCIIGAKDIDAAEREFLDDLGVRMYTLFDIDRLGIFNVMDEVFVKLQHCESIHVSFDVDVLDPLIAPGTGILSKGGLSYREAVYLMTSFSDKSKIRSIDIIEINPLMDIRNTTAELAIELLLAAIGGSFGDYERSYLLTQKAQKP